MQFVQPAALSAVIEIMLHSHLMGISVRMNPRLEAMAHEYMRQSRPSVTFVCEYTHTQSACSMANLKSYSPKLTI